MAKNSPDAACGKHPPLELYDQTILSGTGGKDFAALQKIYFEEKAKRA